MRYDLWGGDSVTPEERDAREAFVDDLARALTDTTTAGGRAEDVALIIDARIAQLSAVITLKLAAVGPSS